MENELLDKITEIAFFLGCEVDASNAPMVAEYMNTLYELREFIKQRS